MRSIILLALIAACTHPKPTPPPPDPQPTTSGVPVEPTQTWYCVTGETGGKGCADSKEGCEEAATEICDADESCLCDAVHTIWCNAANQYADCFADEQACRDSYGKDCERHGAP